MRYRVQCGWLLPVSRPGRTLSPHLSEMRRHTRLSGRRRWDGLYRQRWVADNRCLKNFDERPHRRGWMFHCGKFNVAPVCFSSPPIGTLVDSVRRKSDVIFFQKFHFLLEDLDPWLDSVWLLWLTRVHFPAGISIGLSVFAVLILVSQKQTHRPCICRKEPHLRTVRRRCGLIIYEPWVCVTYSDHSRGRHGLQTV